MFIVTCAIVIITIVFVSPYKQPYKRYNKLDVAMILPLGIIFAGSKDMSQYLILLPIFPHSSGVFHHQVLSCPCIYILRCYAYFFCGMLIPSLCLHAAPYFSCHHHCLRMLHLVFFGTVIPTSLLSIFFTLVTLV